MISSPEKSHDTHVYNYDTILNGTKYKVKFKVCNKKLMGETSNSKRTMNTFTRKVLPLNVDSFFEFKLKMLWKRDLRC